MPPWATGVARRVAVLTLAFCFSAWSCASISSGLVYCRARPLWPPLSPCTRTGSLQRQQEGSSLIALNFRLCPAWGCSQQKLPTSLALTKTARPPVPPLTCLKRDKRRHVILMQPQTACRIRLHPRPERGSVGGTTGRDQLSPLIPFIHTQWTQMQSGEGVTLIPFAVATMLFTCNALSQPRAHLIPRLSLRCTSWLVTFYRQGDLRLKQSGQEHKCWGPIPGFKSQLYHLIVL